jgi:hypothetical protein
MRVGWVLLAALVGCGNQITVVAGDGGGGVGGDGGAGEGGRMGCRDDGDCSDLVGPCIEGVCDDDGLCSAVPMPDGTTCNDDFYCTAASACSAGACVDAGPPVCVSNDPCQMAICDEDRDECTTGPVDGPMCDDGDPCTASDSCVMGVCLGQGPPAPYFEEDFADNAAGWTLGPEWQIAPATASGGQQMGQGDPGTDTTPTADNGIAGIVIGGNASTLSHPASYLESPSFDTRGNDPVVLSFERWLNTDYAPFMSNRVEVWNGTVWNVVWSSDVTFIEDAFWTHQEFDLTPHRNEAMRIRFAMSVDFGGAFVVSSWNLDDVVVGRGACQ